VSTTFDGLKNLRQLAVPQSQDEQDDENESADLDDLLDAATPTTLDELEIMVDDIRTLVLMDNDRCDSIEKRVENIESSVSNFYKRIYNIEHTLKRNLSKAEINKIRWGQVIPGLGCVFYWLSALSNHEPMRAGSLVTGLLIYYAILISPKVLSYLDTLNKPSN